MKLFKRAQRMWKLSKKDKEQVDKLMEISEDEVEEIPDEGQKAEFLSFGDDEEYNEYLDEQKGFKNIFGKGK